MTALEALAKIKTAIKQHFGDEEPVKLESAKLKDGNSIEYSALEAGGEISAVDADGNKTPAAAGDYVLEDGRTIVVTEAGKIAEVKAAAEEQKMAEEPAEEKSASPALDFSQDIKYLKEQLAYVAKQLATIVTAQQMFKEHTGGVLTSMSEFMETVAAEGKAEPITKPKQTLFSDTSKTKQSAFEKAQAAVKAFNEKQKLGQEAK